MKFLKAILILLIAVFLYFSAYSVLHGDIGYNTDIGRDLLILQEIVDTHKLPLIGPHSGLGGLFHGPLWPYINLPAFILGNGNPIVIGWFWVLLVLGSVFTTYYVGKKMFNEHVGLLSALVVSLISITYSNSLLNPFGAVIFSPLFFYFFYKYLKSEKIVFLLLSFFTIGILIQFEIVFGGPILILSLILLSVLLYKRKKLQHLFSALILIVPLSTYIVFELRHNFLQLRSIIAQAGTHTGDKERIFSELLSLRYNELIKNILQIPSAPSYLTIVVALMFGYMSIKCYKNKKLKNREFYLLYAYFYLGFWPISFYLNGQVMGYHILPFAPIAIIILSSGYFLIRKEIFIAVFALVLFFNFLAAKGYIEKFSVEIGNATSSWQFNHEVAQSIYRNAPPEFGYFSFTADEFGYGPTYAMVFTNKEYPGISALPNTKKQITYMIMAPTENGNNNNREWWIKNKVRIDRIPESVINYANGYRIEKYVLSNEEVKVLADPNLLNGLFFR